MYIRGEGEIEFRPLYLTPSDFLTSLSKIHLAHASEHRVSEGEARAIYIYTRESPCKRVRMYICVCVRKSAATTTGTRRFWLARVTALDREKNRIHVFTWLYMYIRVKRCRPAPVRVYTGIYTALKRDGDDEWLPNSCTPVENCVALLVFFLFVKEEESYIRRRDYLVKCSLTLSLRQLRGGTQTVKESKRKIREMRLSRITRRRYAWRMMLAARNRNQRARAKLVALDGSARDSTY